MMVCKMGPKISCHFSWAEPDDVGMPYSEENHPILSVAAGMKSERLEKVALQQRHTAV